MRLLCTQSFVFFNAQDPREKCRAKALEIVDLPNWVKYTGTFKSGYKSGAIKVMNDGTETKTVEKVLENTTGVGVQVNNKIKKATVTKPTTKKK